LRREIIISEECEKRGLHLPTEIVRNVISYVYPDDYSIERECIRVGCDAIALPNPDPKRRTSIHDDFTCNNEACATKCAWYERDGQGFERCNADRATRGIFCASGWCKALYKRKGGTTKKAFFEIKSEMEEEGVVFS